MIERDLDKFNSLPEAFFSLARKSPAGLVYKYGKISPEQYEKTKEIENASRSWEQVNFSEAAGRVARMSRFLAKLGVQKGDRVAIISNSRPEWLEADFAVMCCAGVVASIYQSLPANDIGYILFDSGAKVVFAENQEQLDKLDELLKRPVPIPKTEEREASEEKIVLSKIITFEPTSPHPLAVTWQEALRDEGAAHEAYLKCSRDDLATLVYTSGTTGPPKGVMQTHGNHLANIRQAHQARIFADDSALMLVLPLAHSFAKLMGYIGYTTTASLVFPAVASRKNSKLAPASISRDLREGGASVFPLVPRLIEKMKEAVLLRASQQTLLGKLLRATLASSEEVYAAREKGQAPPAGAKIVYRMTAPIRKKIKRQIFGLKFRYVVSGGAKLPPAVGRFFDAIGIDIMEGYGLTETCVATNVNRIGRNKLGTVGPVLASDIELKITAEGEILYRGPNVAKGYLNRPSATAAAWDAEGWFHSGDLGQIDADGYLAITGRKKEIIVTAGGKKIAPESLEQRFKHIKLISQLVVCGEGMPYCVALVTLNADEARGLARPELAARLSAEFEKVNASLASFETVKKILVIKDEFTVDNGILTPTFKVKRAVVAKRFADNIRELYESEKGEQVFFTES